MEGPECEPTVEANVFHTEDVREFCSILFFPV